MPSYWIPPVSLSPTRKMSSSNGDTQQTAMPDVGIVLPIFSQTIYIEREVYLLKYFFPPPYMCSTLVFQYIYFFGALTKRRDRGTQNGFLSRIVEKHLFVSVGRHTTISFLFRVIENVNRIHRGVTNETVGPLSLLYLYILYSFHLFF